MNETTKYLALGRRKESTARVRMEAGNGSILINGKPFEKYFLRETDRIIVMQPLTLTGSNGKFNIAANLTGGGLTGQAGALRLGISRALLAMDESFKDIFRKNGYLTRDSRMKERKKYGLKGARKRFQWTKR
ncbi:MAG: 30S ribosomal protein S9 [Candidatus Omnitrophica bacterium]|jgi:small subunit ribosomal protein S9|nr:30S ribosomal protein S9 [Candidatus Omnitrophota bacterium]MDD3274207.1 30S ribosomal protein S9 [Candidatus Omnitrophota bacterium]MDD5078012.1 30S ribosomal protein S9 [Candidatus Omnitrophota bacterium]MDD5725167.1 30S ribosomal protein S9 [Candidatus Omnitrophota bacterium]